MNLYTIDRDNAPAGFVSSAVVVASSFFEAERIPLAYDGTCIPPSARRIAYAGVSFSRRPRVIKVTR